MVEDLQVCPLHGLLFRWNSLIHSRAMGSWNREGERIICWVPALYQALSTESGSCGEGVWALVGLCRRNVCRNVSSFPVSVFLYILIQINLFKNSLTYLFFPNMSLWSLTLYRKPLKCLYHVIMVGGFCSWCLNLNVTFQDCLFKIFE